MKRFLWKYQPAYDWMLNRNILKISLSYIFLWVFLKIGFMKETETMFICKSNLRFIFLCAHNLLISSRIYFGRSLFFTSCLRRSFIHRGRYVWFVKQTRSLQCWKIFWLIEKDGRFVIAERLGIGCANYRVSDSFKVKSNLTMISGLLVKLELKMFDRIFHST